MRPVEPPERPAHSLWEGHIAPVEGAPAAQEPGDRRWVHPATLTVLGAAVLVAFAVSITMVVQHHTPDRLALAELTAADCLVSEHVREGQPDVTDLERVDCAKRHDAEVFAVLPVGTGADLAAAGELCVAAADRTLDEIQVLGLEVRAMAAGASVAEGDLIICLARDTSGDGLTGRTMMRSQDTDVEE